MESKIETTWSGRMVAWFLKNTQFVVLIFLGIVIGGVFSFINSRTEGFPSPDINLVIISTVYPGASAETVEQQIIKPIEGAIQGVKGVSEYRSTANPNAAIMQVTFDTSADFNAAMGDLRSKVQNVVLPKEVQKPDIFVPAIGLNSSIYGITSDIYLDPAALRDVGDRLTDRIGAVEGVKKFTQRSDISDKIYVHWKQDEIAKRGLSIMQLQQVLAANNVTIPAGTVTLDGRTSSVVTAAPLKNLDDVRSLIIGMDKNVAPIALKDVATIEQTIVTRDQVQRIGFEQPGHVGLTMASAVFYQLDYSSSNDLLKTDAAVRKVLDDVMANDTAFQHIHVVPVYDIADNVRKQTAEIRNGAFGGPIGDGPFKNVGYLLGGIWLVVIAMLIFVNWRAALIAGAAIPFSLLFTLLVMYLEGETLNTLSLFSMILVLGLIVDPAIVVVEAIQHELDLGKRGIQAIMAAVNTIGAGVFMAALTSAIAFVPFGVVSGIFGAMIRHIPATIIPALVASYFVPLLFLTYLSSRWLRSSQTRPLDEDDPTTLWRISRWFIQANRIILDRTWLQVVIIVLAIVLPIGVSGMLFVTKKVVPVQFSTPKDSELLSMTLEYPANISDIARANLVKSAETRISEQSEIKYMYPMKQQTDSITWYLTLQPRSQRAQDSSVYLGQLQQKFVSMNDSANRIFVTLSQVSDGPPSSDFPVSVNIYDDKLDSLRQAAIETGNLLRQDKRVTRVDDGFTDTKNEKIDVVLDQAKVAKLGLSGAQVGQILAGVVGESEVTQFDTLIDGHTRPIKVLLTKDNPPESIKDIQNVVLFVLPTGPILVKDVATVVQSDAFMGINRLNGKRFVTVRAKTTDALRDGPAVQSSIKSFWTADKLIAANLSPSAFEDRGSGNEFVKSFKDLFIACGVAILMTFVALVLFFRSFTQPLIILFAIPLGFLGIFPALALEGGQFGFLEILGLITLIGIVENVGIFLIDLANQRVAKGMSPKDAIALASGIRFRPVFLTKITALGGLLPLMLLSPFWRSLTLVVVAGIITSGVLSLFTTPILYVWFQKRQKD